MPPQKSCLESMEPRDSQKGFRDRHARLKRPRADWAPSTEKSKTDNEAGDPDGKDRSDITQYNPKHTPSKPWKPSGK